jgi:SAM-dependent methyltransferase
MDHRQISHWDAFYAEKRVPLVPSQFGAFVAGEFPDSDLFVDFGCGNGRDTLLFLGQGKRVVAIDASHAAIESVRAALSDDGTRRIQMIHGAVAETATWHEINAALREAAPRSPTLYARFFLHAIDEDAEAIMLDGAAALMREHGGQLCLEFRTPQDQAVVKWAGDHYRRYIALHELVERLAERDLQTSYSAEGFGFARFRGEDAHVARVICSPA